MGLPSPRAVQKTRSPGPKAFTKLKALGKGSFGSVFLVEHMDSGERLVMKEVYLRGLSQRESLRQAQEVSFLQKLNHKHLTMYRSSHVETSSLTLFIILEYCDGGALGTRIDKQAALRSRKSGDAADAKVPRLGLSHGSPSAPPPSRTATTSSSCSIGTSSRPTCCSRATMTSRLPTSASPSPSPPPTCKRIRSWGLHCTCRQRCVGPRAGISKTQNLRNLHPNANASACTLLS